MNSDIQVSRILPEYYIKINDDLYFDFALGVRIYCTNHKKYHVKIYDDYTGILHHQFDTEYKKCFYSDYRFYIKWKIQIYDNNKIIYQHILDLTNQVVVCEIPGSTIGDCLACIPSVDLFQKKHNCYLTFFSKSQNLIDILKNQYPNINITNNQNQLNKSCYAYYYLNVGSMLNPFSNIVDHRLVGLKQAYSYLLHVEEHNLKAKIQVIQNRNVQNKYVVISTSASNTMKEWIKERWIQVVKYLKSLGYIVYQIGLKEQLIDGCENLIGNIHLQNRIDLLYYADMYIGLSSGLAWLADSCNIPVLMICNVTVPTHEFYTKYRVHPTIGCKGCIHNIQTKKITSCQNIQSKQECKYHITVKQVCNTIDKIIQDNKK